MKTADVVIGANFGDEGKGLITDYYAARQGENALVVRFNGGAQAGHTVTTPEGRRHIFSHFGSGSFASAATYLSRFFVCNPLLFLKEQKILSAKTAIPTVYADARAAVTTPYDMMINQIAEEARGHGRHGSCGMGFGETIERNSHAEFATVYGDLADRVELKKKLRHIRDHWTQKRLQALKVAALSEKWRERLASDAVIDNFIQDVAAFLQATRAAAPNMLAETKQKIVFEGAQGLLLDQERGWFPHVTRSHTGIRNILPLAEEAGIETLNVTYTTRAYATRHGAGPLPNELPQPPYPRIKDETNVVNDWQGAIRFGWLDADLLAASIKQDLSDNRSKLRLKTGLAVTCIDQVEEQATYFADGLLKTAGRDDVAALLQRSTGAEFLITSRGPSRAHVSAA